MVDLIARLAVFALPYHVFSSHYWPVSWQSEFQHSRPPSWIYHVRDQPRPQVLLGIFQNGDCMLNDTKNDT